MQISIKVKTHSITKNQTLRQSIVLSASHFLNDFYTGMLFPLLPILISNFGLTKFSAGALNAFLQWPSILQPFVGRWSDKINLQKYIFALPLITGVFLNLIGVATKVTLIALLLLLAGISSAFFHGITTPVAGKMAGKQSGKGLSLWIVGGEIGWMLSPVLIIAFIQAFSFSKTPYLIIPTALISLFLHSQLKKMNEIQEPVNSSAVSLSVALKSILPMLVPILAVATSRSLLQSIISVYVPTYLTETGMNLLLAGIALSLVNAGGILGSIVGGIYKDKVGGKPVLLISMIGCTILFFLFLITSSFLQMIMLFMTGFFSGMYLPVALSLVQDYSQQNRSFASGIYQAYFFSIGSVASLIIGFLYDHLGAHPTFIISGVISLIGTIFISLVPKGEETSSKSAMEV